MKATLPTNYQDDILNVSTDGKRRYRMNYNDDGTVSFIDVTPYDQEGSDFGAVDINRTNEAVNQSFDKNKLIRDMDAIIALTEEGYAPDALALKDVNDSLEWKLAGSVTGTSQIAIPSDAKEIYVEVTRGDSSDVRYDFYLPIISLTNAEKVFTRSYWTSSATYHSCALNTTNKSVSIRQIYASNTTNIADKSTITVYYR